MDCKARYPIIPLVLLPGMMCDARLFAPQIACFSRHRNVLVASLSGHNTVESLASNVLAEAPPRFALAGLSMGGIVAMEILAQAPQRVDRVALLDTNPLTEKDEMKARRELQLAKIQAGNLEQVMREDMLPNYLYDGPQKETLSELCLNMAMELGADVFVRQSQALRNRVDRTDTLRTTHLPALILCGEHDVLCPPERHELMHSLLPESELFMIPEAAHMPTIEQPQLTNAALSRWLIS